MNGIDLLIDTNIAIYVLEDYPLPRGLMQCAVGVSVTWCHNCRNSKILRPASRYRRQSRGSGQCNHFEYL